MNNNNRKIAFLGTGLMGLPMCKSLLQAGFAVTAWNRSIDKAKPLKSFGATIAESANTAVEEADIIFTMLSDGSAVNELLFDQKVFQSIKSPASFIDCSSIAPDIAKRHGQKFAIRNINYIDAPVSGGVVGAEQATLAIMAGGDKNTIDSLSDVFASLGRVTHVGPNGSGQLCKLANQQIVAITIGAVAEAMLFVEAGGASSAGFRDAIRGGFAESRVLELHGLRMVNRDFKPGGPAKFHLKDLHSVDDVAKKYHLELPLTNSIRHEFTELINQGGGDLDHSAIFSYLKKINNNS